MENDNVKNLMEAYEIVFKKHFNPQGWGYGEKELVSYFEEKDITYSEQDIVDLVDHSKDLHEVKFVPITMGTYIGTLITILTEKNMINGERTIIDIPENDLDYLGNMCRKFDVVKIGKNTGDHVFESVRQGKVLYVDDCEGDFFARGALGSPYEYESIDIIAANKVIGENFALGSPCEKKSHINAIIANDVQGFKFAERAGSIGDIGDILIKKVRSNRVANNVSVYGPGETDSIIAVDVDNRDFTWNDTAMPGKVREVMFNSPEAKEAYIRTIKKHKKVLEDAGIDVDVFLEDLE